MSTDPDTGFSPEERAAMRQRSAELRSESKRRRLTPEQKAAAARDEVLAKIASMPDADRALASRVHELVERAAPDLAPKLFYGQPAYARGGKVVCFFRSGQQDADRYSTFGFTSEAALDEPGGLWVTSYALASTVDDAGWRLLEERVRSIATSGAGPSSEAAA